jgi:hypothetical protein
LPALALAAGVAPAGAQPESPQFELVPRVGVLVPLKDLGRATDIATLIQVKIRLDVAASAGLSAQYSPRYLPVSFRLVADYTPFNVRVTGQPALCEIFIGEACVKVPVDARFLVLSADALFRAGEYGRSSFYLVAGLGIKWYDFARLACAADDLVCEQLDRFARDQVNPMVHLALGYAFRLGPARLELEVADYMSTYRAEGEEVSGAVQQDFLVTLGLRLGIL